MYIYLYQQLIVLVFEIVRTSILCCSHNSAPLSVRADGYQPVPTEMNEIPVSPPIYSEV